MKNLYYLLALLLSITACNPVDEIYDELEAGEADVNGVVEYTLVEDDYTETLGLRFPNFNSIEEAGQLIPIVLDSVYPILGEGSTAFVGYDRFFRKSTEDSLVVYTVTNDDYENYPATARFRNFSNNEDVIPFLEEKYPNAVNRMLVSLTYKLYNGRFAETVNNGFLYSGGEWSFITGFTEDEYNEAGEVFANFSSEDEAEFKIPRMLKRRDEFQEEPMVNTIVQTMYKLYLRDESDLDGDDNTSERLDYSFIKNFVYNGENWVEYNNILSETLQFGYEDGVWVPDNTINYTFEREDYNTVSSLFIDTYPGPADNVGFFGSFDRRSASSNYWSDDMLLEAMDAFLDQLDPNAEEEQKYVLTFAVYTGSTITVSYRLIKSNGDWVLNQ